MKTNSEQPAFPRDHLHDGHNGLTKREYFAAMALQGLASKDYAHLHPTIDDPDELTRAISFTAVELADVLIAQLNLQP